MMSRLNRSRRGFAICAGVILAAGWLIGCSAKQEPSAPGYYEGPRSAKGTATTGEADKEPPPLIPRR